MVNGTKVEVSQLGSFKNQTIHKPMAMHEKQSIDRHMVKMGQRSSTVVDDMETNMRRNTNYLIQGAYMIAERFNRNIKSDGYVEFRRLSIKTQNFADDDPLNPQLSRTLRRF